MKRQADEEGRETSGAEAIGSNEAAEPIVEDDTAASVAEAREATSGRACSHACLDPLICRGGGAFRSGSQNRRVQVGRRFGLRAEIRKGAKDRSIGL
jgi:hypothetical protein